MLGAEIGLVIHLQFKSANFCLLDAIITTCPSLWPQKATFQGEGGEERETHPLHPGDMPPL